MTQTKETLLENTIEKTYSKFLNASPNSDLAAFSKLYSKIKSSIDDIKESSSDSEIEDHFKNISFMSNFSIHDYDCNHKFEKRGGNGCLEHIECPLCKKTWFY